MRFLIFLSFIIFIGCNEKSEKDKNEIIDQNKKEQKFIYSVNFPDTVFLNKKYDGEIIYKSPYDTIIDNFSNQEEKRYVVFRTAPSKSYSFLKEFYIDSLQEYRIGAIDNRSIPFYDLSFNKKGNFIIQGLVNDELLLESNTKYNSNKTGVRWIEKDFPVSFKVVVIDSI